MKRFAIFAAMLATTFPATTFGKPASTGYAPVNGLKIYYEIHGAADASVRPLVLLHGGGDTIETSFRDVIGELARTRRVIAFEQQGFGRTADVPDRAFSFEQSADDTAGLLAHLNIEQADVLGFSNGGTIALQMAIRHPQRVGKLVLISTFFAKSGGSPEFWAGMENATVEMMPRELREAYLAVSPHPEKFPTFFEKGVERMRTFKDIPPGLMRAIHSPALVVVGDRDVVTTEHAVQTYRLLTDAQIAVFPATDHGRIMTRNELLVPLVNEFLSTLVN